MAIEAHNRTLPLWFERLRTKQTVLPRFQRFEAWNHANICQLFNTVLQGLPIGATLVLQIGDEEPFHSRPLKGAPEKGDRVTEHLLDGQQRLTALWRGLHNNYDERTYYLFLEQDEETGLPYRVGSIARWSHNGERRPLWAEKPQKLWERRMIPLDLLAPGDAAAAQQKAWLKSVLPDANDREDVTELLQHAREKFITYNIPYLSLPVATPKQTALDVFIRMNTSAEPLSIFDVVVAQVEASMDRSLHDLVADARTHCPEIEAYYDPSDLALYAGALMQSKPPVHSTYLSKDFGRQLLDNWDRYIRGLKEAVAFLESERVFDGQRLPTEVAVPVLVALWANAPEKTDALGKARTQLRRYFWRACFTDRYDRSTSFRSLADFSELQQAIDGSSDKTPSIFDDEPWPLPTVHELLGFGWPKRKDRLARAVLAVSLRKGGLDLADGSPASRANLGKREYHHLFPDAHLQRLGVPGDKIYRALNCALVSWQTNRTISAKDPEKYLAERLEGSPLGESEVRTRLESHLVPYDELKAGDYDSFLNARAELVHEAMARLCEGNATL